MNRLEIHRSKMRGGLPDGNDFNLIASTVRIRCSGHIHRVTLHPYGSIVLHDHTKRNVEALMVGTGLGLADTGCLRILKLLRERAWHNGVLRKHAWRTMLNLAASVRQGRYTRRRILEGGARRAGYHKQRAIEKAKTMVVNAISPLFQNSNLLTFGDGGIEWTHGDASKIVPYDADLMAQRRLAVPVTWARWVALGLHKVRTGPDNMYPTPRDVPVVSVLEASDNRAVVVIADSMMVKDAVLGGWFVNRVYRLATVARMRSPAAVNYTIRSWEVTAYHAMRDREGRLVGQHDKKLVAWV